MLRALVARFRQGRRTIPFPDREPELPPRFRGRPEINRDNCIDQCRACADACPTNAIAVSPEGPRIDLGRCLFCIECGRACPGEAIRYTGEYRLATSRRADLVAGPGEYRTAEALAKDLRSLLGRALCLRQVSAGGCNGCEAEVNATGNIIFDAARFGIQFVPSPRHADGLLVTGPVTANMREALLKAYDAVPDPRIVVALGACAISGGPYAGHAETNDGIGDLLPVDLYIPGCPPHPVTILDGLLRMLGGR